MSIVWTLSTMSKWTSTIAWFSRSAAGGTLGATATLTSESGADCSCAFGVSSGRTLLPAGGKLAAGVFVAPDVEPALGLTAAGGWLRPGGSVQRGPVLATQPASRTAAASRTKTREMAGIAGASMRELTNTKQLIVTFEAAAWAIRPYLATETARRLHR